MSRQLREVVNYFEVDDMSSCRYSFGADDYYVGEHESMTLEAKDVMKNSYRSEWAEAARSGSTDDSFDEWIDDVLDHDGFSTILDRYDGEGMSAKVDGRTYYICRP